MRSIGEYKWIPLSALISAGIRLIYTTLGYGLEHDGDILGTKQWLWLENVLESSTSSKDDFHVIVSSIQVFTSNPIVESWNHYPNAKRKLLNFSTSIIS
mmetsp:Transcript_20249/g.20955  ORF Transcript_20249/g.20955 Transcript_20249/m.20955 type:complete len:99 (+) Transcript_20249:2039-2335(+)